MIIGRDTTVVSPIDHSHPFDLGKRTQPPSVLSFSESPKKETFLLNDTDTPVQTQLFSLELKKKKLTKRKQTAAKLRNAVSYYQSIILLLTEKEIQGFAR